VASLKPITAAEVPRIFDDVCIDQLADIGGLPESANRKRFGQGVREAACIYLREVQAPNVNKLHAEIAALNTAAQYKRYGQVADLLDKLSPKAIGSLSKRKLSLELPTSADLREPRRQELACEAVFRLSQYGGRFVEGRRRPSGNRSSPTWRPLLIAPEPQRHVLKRDAEQNFVMFLQIAWLDATGGAPILSASATKPGPFTRMVTKCLKLVGAGHANAAGVINRLKSRGKKPNS
jgi:hypothetical protein